MPFFIGLVVGWVTAGAGFASGSWLYIRYQQRKNAQEFMERLQELYEKRQALS